MRVRTTDGRTGLVIDEKPYDPTKYKRRPGVHNLQDYVLIKYNDGSEVWVAKNYTYKVSDYCFSNKAELIDFLRENLELICETKEKYDYDCNWATFEAQIIFDNEIIKINDNEVVTMNRKYD